MCLPLTRTELETLSVGLGALKSAAPARNFLLRQAERVVFGRQLIAELPHCVR
jgi:hypothetical protein